MNYNEFSIQNLAQAVKEGRRFIQDSLDQFDNPTHVPVRCTAGNNPSVKLWSQI